MAKKSKLHHYRIPHGLAKEDHLENPDSESRLDLVEIPTHREPE
jgi:hypothetical protein